MKIILEGDEAELYILSRHVDEVDDLVKKLKQMHNGLSKCNRFELTDLCDKIDALLSKIEGHLTIQRLQELTISR